MGLHYPLVDVADLVAPDNGPDLRAAISGSEEVQQRRFS